MLKEILRSQHLLALQQALQNQDLLLIEELWNAPKALIAAWAQKVTGKHILILTGTSQEGARLFHDFELFTDVPILDFPSRETFPSENISLSPDIVGEQYQALRKLLVSPNPILFWQICRHACKDLLLLQFFKTFILF